jgi:hypothetical protein
VDYEGYKMLAKQSIIKSVVIFFLLIWFTNANAAIYKWRDENGITHFTDNLNKVPKAFREKPFIKNLLPRKIKSEPKDKNTQSKQIDAIKRDEPAEDKIKEVKKKDDLTEAQRLAIEKVINFLKTDILRYEKFYTYPPSRSKFRVLKQAVAGATVQKQELLKQVNQHNIPVFKEIAGYLEKSIEKDKKSQKVMPTTITSTRQTLKLENRLKGETEKGTLLLIRLTLALKTKK